MKSFFLVIMGGLFLNNFDVNIALNPSIYIKDLLRPNVETIF